MNPQESGQQASVVLRRRIEWIDTDPAGIAHWLTCLRLVEVAESALHTSLGIAERTLGALPRLAVSVAYHGPLRFNDLAVIHLGVDAVGSSSLRYSFSITGPSGSAASGTIDSCLIDPVSNRPRPWPDEIRTSLEHGGPQPPGEGR